PPTGDVVSLPIGGTCSTGTECQYADWVSANGVMLTRVLAPCTADRVTPGTFCVDYGQKAIYVGSDPSGQDVEYSYVPGAILSLPTTVGVRVSNMTSADFADTAQVAQVIIARDGWTAPNLRMTATPRCGPSIN